MTTVAASSIYLIGLNYYLLAILTMQETFRSMFNTLSKPRKREVSEVGGSTGAFTQFSPERYNFNRVDFPIFHFSKVAVFIDTVQFSRFTEEMALEGYDSETDSEYD